jgi:hypothetical protein
LTRRLVGGVLAGALGHGGGLEVGGTERWPRGFFSLPHLGSGLSVEADPWAATDCRWQW